jgi:RHS repeat-associated protein
LQAAPHKRSRSFFIKQLTSKKSAENVHSTQAFGTTSYQATNSTITAAFKRYRYTGMERLNADPIGIGDGVNVYAYCHNNPVTNTDTNGKQVTQEAADRLTAYRAQFVPGYLDKPKEQTKPLVIAKNPSDLLRSAGGSAAGGTASSAGNATYNKKTEQIQTSLKTTAGFAKQGLVSKDAVQKQEKAIIENEKNSGAGNIGLFVLGVAALAITAPLVGAEVGMIARFGLPALKTSLTSGGAYSLLKVGEAYVGSTTMRASVEVMAQTAANKGDISKLDVADVGFTALTPFGSSLFGGAADWRPFNPKDNGFRSVLGTGDNNKPVMNAVTDFGIKLTFGGAGLLKPFNNSVSTIGTPQLAPVFSAPFNFGGKLIGNEIKKELINVDTTKKD